ncbi:MAG TPA: asparagine synthase (glutamine-hydrolyzing) [Aggregatilinea sp.]|uniref:asparagine synthase (glutamine-hydrolyzing) n=1 Tax=Aggregatilinea sp. TaxID=2806333 RepID=UPI002D01E09E|nr:asparagine synthase (glutamine-hydrolyzing) [Aggregatilinea sp.]HML23365.1 asparagine synthase (glutamine-hydrolyzing) [Aggregatilinea sp.]
MCGIYGQFNPHGADPILIERMAACLAHRGPDGYGTFHDGALAFGAGRLAIIDLAAGVQPLFNEDRSVAVVFNGEIYNYRALRAALQAEGHVFATGTDTEVIVHGYEAWGLDVLTHLRGMFAIGIWDRGQQRLFLARDRMGEKPLYVARRGDDLLFASEIKALLEHPGVGRAVCDEALVSYLSVGYVAPPLTLFEGIEKLAPGEWLRVDAQGIETGRYWQPEMDTLHPFAGSYDEAVRRTRDMLTEAVEMRLMSDVPLGVFLSGGVDSTAVAALVSRAVNQPVQSFTVGFDHAPGSKGDTKFNVDTRYAAVAAQALKAEHHLITIRQDDSLAALFPHLIHAMDEPIVQPAIVQTAYVAALARLKGVPVLLSGDGSDEIFGGYAHYRADRLLERYLGVPGLLRSAILTPLLERAPARFDGARKLAQKSRAVEPVERYLHWMRIVDPAQFPDLLARDGLAGRASAILERSLRPILDAPHTAHFADRIAYTSLRRWVAEDSNMRVDKMSMAMSIEARAPFEDHDLVGWGLSLPLGAKLRGGGFKTVLKDAVRDLVPGEILNRPKWGFIPPSSDWLRTVLRPLVETHLSRERIEAAGVFRPETVARLVDDHMTRRGYELWPLWAILSFQIWHAIYIDGSLTLDHKLAPADLADAIVR